MEINKNTGVTSIFPLNYCMFQNTLCFIITLYIYLFLANYIHNHLILIAFFIYFLFLTKLTQNQLPLILEFISAWKHCHTAFLYISNLCANVSTWEHIHLLWMTYYKKRNAAYFTFILLGIYTELVEKN